MINELEWGKVISKCKKQNKKNEAQTKEFIELKLETALTWITDSSSQKLISEAINLLKKL